MAPVTTPLPASHVPPTPERRRAGARITLTLAALAMIGPFSIDTVFPAFTRIGQEFAADEVALQQLVSAYLAAFAVMSIFHGPLSDALGRKKVMIGGLVIYLIGIVGSVLAPSLGSLVLLRVLQGMSAGAATIVSRVVIRDMFSGAEAQRLMAQIMMIFSVAPALAPIFAGWLLLLGDWRWVFVGVGLYAVAVLLLTLALPETLPPEARTPLRVRSLLGSLLHVGCSPVMLRIASASAFVFASQFLFVVGAPPFTGGLHWSLLLAVLGPMLIAFAVALVFAPIQLEVMDLFPHERGAAASLGTFFGLMLNALLAGAVAPLVTTSLHSLALTSLGFALLGGAMWLWHLRSVQPAADGTRE